MIAASATTTSAIAAPPNAAGGTRRLSVIPAAIACLTFVVAGAAASGGGRADGYPLALKAQVPAASFYVSPTGNDAGPCTQVAPCASFDRAYKLAKPGQVVEVAGGEYGSQVIESRPTTRNLNPGCAPGSTAPCIGFRPAAG